MCASPIPCVVLRIHLATQAREEVVVVVVVVVDSQRDVKDNKERITQSKRARVGSLAIVD